MGVEDLCETCRGAALGASATDGAAAPWCGCCGSVCLLALAWELPLAIRTDSGSAEVLADLWRSALC